MRPGGGSVKGADFERLICTQLSTWANGTKEVFWRTAGSGSRSTRTGSRSQAGDVGATSDIGHAFIDHVVVECKCYSKVNWPQFFFDRKGEFWVFWEKVMAEGVAHKKWPMLIVKENGRFPMVVIIGYMAEIFKESAPSLLILPPPDTDLFDYGVYFLHEILTSPYNKVCARLTDFPDAFTANHRSTPDRPPRTRLPLKVPRVALRQPGVV